MDWQDKFSQLVGIVDPTRSFPRDFKWDDEATIDALIAGLRTHAKTDAQVELVTVKTRLAEKDAVYAAEQRLKAAGVKQADIDALKGK